MYTFYGLEIRCRLFVELDSIVEKWERIDLFKRSKEVLFLISNFYFAWTKSRLAALQASGGCTNGSNNTHLALLPRPKHLFILKLISLQYRSTTSQLFDIGLDWFWSCMSKEYEKKRFHMIKLYIRLN